MVSEIHIVGLCRAEYVVDVIICQHHLLETAQVSFLFLPQG